MKNKKSHQSVAGGFHGHIPAQVRSTWPDGPTHTTAHDGSVNSGGDWKSGLRITGYVERTRRSKHFCPQQAGWTWLLLRTERSVGKRQADTCPNSFVRRAQGAGRKWALAPALLCKGRWFSAQVFFWFLFREWGALYIRVGKEFQKWVLIQCYKYFLST